LADVQTVSVLIATASVTLAAAYYILQMREQNKNRQAQLFMQIYSHYLDKIVEDEMTLYTMEYKNYDDFMDKYGWKSNPEFFKKFNKFVSYLEGVGVLVKRGLIDPSMVYDLNGGLVRWYWEKSKPFWLEFRARNNERNTVEYTEYLYDRLSKMDEDKSSQETTRQ
jgi:hypothetical protein